jgi:hypothetical protein
MGDAVGRAHGVIGMNNGAEQFVTGYIRIDQGRAVKVLCDLIAGRAVFAVSVASLPPAV